MTQPLITSMVGMSTLTRPIEPWSVSRLRTAASADSRSRIVDGFLSSGSWSTWKKVSG